MLSWDEMEPINLDFWRGRLSRAIARRQSLADDPDTTAYRLVNAEADGLPRLIVDRYGDYLAVQFLALGIDRRRQELVSLLVEVLSPRGIYERDDAEVQHKEGLTEAKGILWGEEPPPLVEVRENGFRFLVDIKRGHKTGFYLNQRENRRKLMSYAKGQEVLNCFAYTGTFSVYGAAGGATRITEVESSPEVLDLGRHNLAINGFADPSREAAV